MHCVLRARRATSHGASAPLVWMARVLRIWTTGVWVYTYMLFLCGCCACHLVNDATRVKTDGLWIELGVLVFGCLRDGALCNTNTRITCGGYWWSARETIASFHETPSDQTMFCYLTDCFETIIYSIHMAAKWFMLRLSVIKWRKTSFQLVIVAVVFCLFRKFTHFTQTRMNNIVSTQNANISWLYPKHYWQ